MVGGGEEEVQRRPVVLVVVGEGRGAPPPTPDPSFIPSWAAGAVLCCHLCPCACFGRLCKTLPFQNINNQLLPFSLPCQLGLLEKVPVLAAISGCLVPSQCYLASGLCVHPFSATARP